MQNHGSGALGEGSWEDTVVRGRNHRTDLGAEAISGVCGFFAMALRSLTVLACVAAAQGAGFGGMMQGGYGGGKLANLFSGLSGLQAGGYGGFMGGMMEHDHSKHSGMEGGMFGGMFGGMGGGLLSGKKKMKGGTMTGGYGGASEGTGPAATADGDAEEGCTTVVEAASAVDDLSILVEAVTAAGDDVVELLSDPDAELTVFAPTNAAFESTLEELGVSKETLLGNETLLLGLLSYHVVPDVAAKAEDLTDGQELTTLLGPSVPLTVELEGSTVVIEGVGSKAEVVVPDVEACSAVVHVIDNVLIPVS